MTGNAGRGKAVKLGGDEVVRVEFENPHAITDTPLCFVQSGVVFLDPKRF